MGIYFLFSFTFRFTGFPGGLEVKASSWNVGDLGLIPGSGRPPGEGNGNPLQYSGLENPHGQRSLVGSSPWGYKEADTNEQLSTHTHTPGSSGRDKLKDWD